MFTVNIIFVILPQKGKMIFIVKDFENKIMTTGVFFLWNNFCSLH